MQVLLAKSPEISEAVPIEKEAEAPLEISPVLISLTLGMSYNDVLAQSTSLVASESKDNEKTLSGELESWGALGYLDLSFDANDTLYSYTWYYQVGKPSCTLLDEACRSETAQKDTETVYQAMCNDMLALADVVADEEIHLGFTSDGGKYAMLKWTQGVPQRVCVWVVNPLDYFFCRLTVSDK